LRDDHPDLSLLAFTRGDKAVRWHRSLPLSCAGSENLVNRS
jgi:hypothetical protein